MSENKKTPAKAIKFANIVIGITIIFISFILVYLLSRYSILGFFARVIICLVFLSLIGLVYSFKAPSAYKINLSLVILSVGGTLYLFELILSGVLTFSDKHAKKIKYWQSLGLDTRSKSRVIEDLKKEGVKAVPFIVPSLFFSSYDPKGNGKTTIPLRGISERMTVLCNESGKWSIYESDEHGFNNPKGLYNPGDLDIAAVGSSFTQGYCVDPDKNAIALIRDEYPKTLNFGVGGLGPLTSLAIFKEYVEPLRPKIVLWIYTETTIGRLNKEEVLLDYLSKEYKQDLFTRKPEVDQTLQEYLKYVDSVKYYRRQVSNKWLEVLLLRGLQERFSRVLKKLKTPSLSSEVQYERFRKILTVANSSTSEWEGELIFVYLPLSHDKPSNDHDPILSTVRELEIPIIDLYPAFANYVNPLDLYPFQKPALEGGNHFNENGYKLMAETILSQLEITEK